MPRKTNRGDIRTKTLDAVKNDVPYELTNKQIVVPVMSWKR